MKKKTLSALISAVVVIVAALLGIPIYEEATTPEPTVSTVAPANGESFLMVHTIDVGQADCIFIECDGQTLLIDGGNRDDGQLVVSYLQQQGVEKIDTVVCTHAHEDHVGGLPAVLAVFPVGKVYSPTKTYSSKIFDSFLRYVDQQKLEVTLPVPGDTFAVGGATATILGPVQSYADPNNTSIVLRLDHGENSFLFTGDMEIDAETDMMNHWNDDSLFQVDVLKMGHHGSSTSTGYRLLNATEATYALIPVGKNNDYGHPHRETLEKIRQASLIAMRTDELGTILARSDGKELSFTWENQSVTPADLEPAEPSSYFGNKNSKTFHTSSCGSLPSEKNRVEFATYQQAMDAGYKPCTGCLK